MRPMFIAGNWKMNPSTKAAAIELAKAIREGVGSHISPRVALCPPSIFLADVDDALAGSPIGVGAQNMHWKADGAYTGELSAAMLVDVGCTHVILGHSERRHGMGETDAMVNQKLYAALEARLIPIVCIGELLEERQSGKTESVISSQLDGSLAGLTAEQMAGVVLAYEPVWAIGTGVVATPQQAQETHAFIRSRLAAMFDQATADRVVVQYGGSAKAENVRELLACPDIDGALVGGASLKPADFLGILVIGRAVESSLS